MWHLFIISYSIPYSDSERFQKSYLVVLQDRATAKRSNLGKAYVVIPHYLSCFFWSFFLCVLTCSTLKRTVTVGTLHVKVS